MQNATARSFPRRCTCVSAAWEVRVIITCLGAVITIQVSHQHIHERQRCSSSARIHACRVRLHVMPCDHTSRPYVKSRGPVCCAAHPRACCLHPQVSCFSKRALVRNHSPHDIANCCLPACLPAYRHGITQSTISPVQWRKHPTDLRGSLCRHRADPAAQNCKRPTGGFCVQRAKSWEKSPGGDDNCTRGNRERPCSGMPPVVIIAVAPPPQRPVDTPSLASGGRNATWWPSMVGWAATLPPKAGAVGSLHCGRP